MVIHIAAVGVCHDLSSAHTTRHYREPVLQPVDHIQILHVLLGDLIAAEGIEVLPVP